MTIRESAAGPLPSTAIAFASPPADYGSDSTDGRDKNEYKRMDDDHDDLEFLNLGHTPDGGFVLNDTRLRRVQFMFAGIVALQVGFAMLKMYIIYRRDDNSILVPILLGLVVFVLVTGVCLGRLLINRFHPQLLQVRKNHNNNAVVVYKDNRNVGLCRTIWSGTHEKVELSRLRALRLERDHHENNNKVDKCKILASRDDGQEIRLLDAETKTAEFALKLLQPFVTETKDNSTSMPPVGGAHVV